MRTKVKIRSFLNWRLLLQAAVLSCLLCSAVQAQEKSDSKILITIQRTGCYGKCPIYSAQIYSDGTVRYQGKRFVKATGERQHKISEDKIKALIRAFEKVKYFSLKNSYTRDKDGTTFTDLPTTTTSISLNGKQKKVVNYFGAPDELDELENLIDELAGLGEYIGRDARSINDLLGDDPL